MDRTGRGALLGRVDHTCGGVGVPRHRHDRVQVRVAGFGKTEHNMHKNNLDHFKRADGQGDVLAGSPRLLESAVETIATTVCKNRYSTSVVGPGQVCTAMRPA